MLRTLPGETGCLSPRHCRATTAPFKGGRRRSATWYEDFLLSNARIFVAAGIAAIKVQDEARKEGLADACDADFVRLKVFVGAAYHAEGLRTALNIPATHSRAAISRTDIKIYAGVHGRTDHPPVRACRA